MKLLKSFNSIVAAAFIMLLALVCLGFNNLSFSATPATGSIISNVAYVEYTDGSGQKNANSNTVQVTIAQVASFTLTASQTKTGQLGETVYFPHIITNTGNGPDRFNLQLAFGPGPAQLSDLNIYADTNNDLLPDSSLAITQTPIIAAGSTYTFLASTKIVVTSPIGQSKQIVVSASGDSAYGAGAFTPAVTQNNIDTINTIDSAFISIDKNLSVVGGPTPNNNSGTHIRVNLNYRNTGQTVATNVKIVDILESNNTLKPLATYLAGSSTILYNTEKFTYVPGSAIWSKGGSLDDADDGNDGGPGGGIEYKYDTTNKLVNILIPNIPAGDTGTLSFLIDVLPNAPTGTAKTSNVAGFTYFDGALNKNGASTTASYNVISFVDLQVAKTGPGSATAGFEYFYDVTIKNTGSQPTSAAIPISIVDNLARGVQFIRMETANTSAGISCTSNAQHLAPTGETVSCTYTGILPVYDTLQPALTSRVVRLVVKPDAVFFMAPSATINNTATVSSAEENVSNTANNTSNTVATTLGASGSVSGKIWLDVDHNKSFGGADVALPNYSVNICQYNDSEDASGNPVIVVDANYGRAQRITGVPPPVLDCSSTGSNLVNGVNGVSVPRMMTNTNGEYTFTGLQPGLKYKIEFRDPSGQVITGAPLNQMGGSTSFLHWSRRFLIIDLQPGDNILAQNLPLDPSGVVYNSKTRQPVAGAQVTLTGPAGFNADIHLLGGAANLIQTTSVNGNATDGMYQYVLVGNFPSGIYNIAVSTVPANFLPGNSKLFPAQSGAISPPANCVLQGNKCSVDPANSSLAPPNPTAPFYFMSFNINNATGIDIINNHVPIDPIDPNAVSLLLSKSAHKTSAEIGDSIEYTLRLQNTLPITVTGVKLQDILPGGFVYQKSTAMLEGVPLAEPVMNDKTLTWNLPGSLPTGQTWTIKYRIQISGLAKNGSKEKINRATVFTNQAQSIQAIATVRLIDGIFTDKAYVFGRVYLACGKDDKQISAKDLMVDKNSLGVPGVRLWLDDGSYVITDENGQYSFYGLLPRSHVIKIDPITLPKGYKLINLNQRQLSDPASWFIDLKKADMFKANFALVCTPEIQSLVKAKIKEASNIEISNVEQKIAPELSSRQASSDPRSAPASGEIRRAVMQEVKSNNVIPSPVIPPSTPTPSSVDNKSNALEELMVTLSPDLGFIDLKDGQTLGRQALVRVKGPFGATLKLNVNGKAVTGDRVGKKASLQDKNIQALEYVGVTLEPGKNELELIESDQFGNAKKTVKTTVNVAGEIAKILVENSSTLLADGSTDVTILVKVFDNLNMPVLDRMPLSIDASDVIWKTKDNDTSEPGLQTFTEQGQVQLTMQSPNEPKTYKIKIRAGNMVSEQTLDFLPNLRPMIGVGLVEGVFNFKKMNPKNIYAVEQGDGFEDEIEKFSGKNAGVRTSMFLKGKIKGDYLLTMSYDSDKSTKNRLFRDINPEDFYPIYGDSSTRGFDAQSTEKLYLRIDKDKSFILYGDYSTQSDDPRQLSQYTRFLTGAKGRYEKDKIKAEAFVSYNSTRQIIEEIKANGTSGPYQLANLNGIINSEKVEIIVRDRNNPGIIIKTETRARFSDYEIESLAGRILFKQPVPSFDINSNPVTIRVTYETETGGTKYWVYGVQGSYQVTDKIEVGGAYIQSKDPVVPLSMTGGYVQYKPNDKSTIVAEIAQTKTVIGTGTATRVSAQNTGELQILGDKPSVYNLKGQIGGADKKFDNPNSPVNLGQADAKVEADLQLTPTLKLSSELSRSSNLNTNASREMLFVAVDYDITPSITTRIGLRHTEDIGTSGLGIGVGGPIDTNSLNARITYKQPKYDIYGELEQEIGGGRQIAAVGGEYRLENTGRIYGRHEFVSTLSPVLNVNGQPRNSTTVGMDFPWSEDVQVYSEYRMRGAIGGREAEAALGLKNKWELMDGVRVSGTLERIQSIQAAPGSATGSSTASSTSIESTKEDDKKWNTKYEWRRSPTETSNLISGGYAQKITEPLSFLVRGAWYRTSSLSPINRMRVLGGFAYRPKESDEYNHWIKAELYNENLGVAGSTKTVASSWHMNAQPNLATLISHRVALKKTWEKYNNIESNFSGMQYSGRLTYDLKNKFDIGLLWSYYRDTLGASQKGLGLEVGYEFSKNMWLSAGYSAWLMDEDKFTTTREAHKGFYVKFRMKFDEDNMLIRQLKSKEEK